MPKTKNTQTVNTFGNIPNVEERNLIPCPVPGHNGMVEVIKTNGRNYAICYCPGKPKHYGQIVWEQIPKKRS